jgi:hypothetical protein
MQTGEGPAWFRSFREWLDEPSPAGEWLYRGQAARYGSVLPSLLREPNRQFYAIELFELSGRVVDGVLSSSPLLGPARIHPHVATSQPDVELTHFAAAVFGTPPTVLPRLSVGEIVRALAQHYGFPTFFVDLSLDPLVAAFFATHEYTGGHYIVRESGPGAVYRWPAIRSSAARLELPADGAGDAEDTIKAIDLTGTSAYVRRPHNQRAVLATPVSRPPGPVPARPFVTPLEAYTVVDLCELESCESFVLPPGAGSELSALTGVGESALFPDRIDLGHSCVSLMAFLSMVVHHPDDGGQVHDESVRTNLLKRFDDAMSHAGSILEHESLRLVPGYRAALTKRHSLVECAAFLDVCANDARRAFAALDSPGVAAAAAENRRQLAKAAREQFAVVEEAWNAAMAGATGERQPLSASDGSAEEVEAVWHGPGRDWVLPEIERRREQIQDVVAYAALVPAYAFESEETYHRYLDAMPNDPEYEAEVRRLMGAQRVWMPDYEAFPAFS